MMPNASSQTISMPNRDFEFPAQRSHAIFLVLFIIFISLSWAESWYSFCLILILLVFSSRRIYSHSYYPGFTRVLKIIWTKMTASKDIPTLIVPWNDEVLSATKGTLRVVNEVQYSSVGRRPSGDNAESREPETTPKTKGCILPRRLRALWTKSDSLLKWRSHRILHFISSYKEPLVPSNGACRWL